MLTALLDTDLYSYSNGKPPLPSSDFHNIFTKKQSQRWQENTHVDETRQPTIGRENEDYASYGTIKSWYAGEDNDIHDQNREQESKSLSHEHDTNNRNTEVHDERNDHEDEDADLTLEEQVLTPTRLKNRRNWIMIAKQASAELQEFAALESSIVQRSIPQSTSGSLRQHLADYGQDNATTLFQTDESITPTKSNVKYDKHTHHDQQPEEDEVLPVNKGHDTPRQVDSPPQERHAMSIHRLLEDSALLSLSEPSEQDERNNSALLADLESADISAIEQTDTCDMTQTSILVEQATNRHELDDVQARPNHTHVSLPVEEEKENRLETNERPPSPSKILQKFFPKSTMLPKRKSQSTVNETAYLELKERVNSLESQVFKLKEQNHKLVRERDDMQRNAKRVETQKSDFEKYRTEEIARLKALHEEEMKNLKREKQLWEKQRKAAEILPSKKERLEIEALKQQLQQQFQSAKQKENRILLAQDRLKKKLEEVTKKNQELQDEIKILEQERAAFVELHRSRQARMTEVPAVANRNGHVSQQVKIIKHEPVQKRHSIDDLRNQHTSTSQSAEHRNPNPIIEPLTGVRRNQPSSKSAVMTVKESPSEKAQLDELQKAIGLVKPTQVKRLEDGTIERHYGNGTVLCCQSNGTLKQNRPDGIEIIYLTNKDQKTIYPDGRCVYWYAEPKTLQTMYPDGIQVFEFASGQYEKHYPDGRQEINFPDNTKKFIFGDGQEQIVLPDGRVYRIDVHGNRVMEYPNGFCRDS